MPLKPAFGQLRHDTTRGMTMLPLVRLLLLLDLVSATHWTVTSYFALSITTVTYFDYDSSPTFYTRTQIQTVKPDATITAVALSTSSVTYSYDDLEVVRVWLPPSAVDPGDIQTTLTDESYDPNDRRYTYYVQPVGYTAPKSCPTPFTVTTSTTVNVPSAVASQVTATATSTSVYTDDYGDAYTRVTAYLDKTYWPSASELSSAYLYSIYVARCENPIATTTSTSRGSASGRNGSGGQDSGLEGGNSSGQGCEPGENCGYIQTWAVAIAVVLPAVFFFGFVESFFWFSRLMTGKATMRFGTVCWLILCCPIVFLTRRVPSRSPEDQDRLGGQWTAMGVGKKLSLWLKLGLRHRYPVDLLGDHPEYKPDGWSGENQMRSQAGKVFFMGQQPSQGQTLPRTAEKGSTLPQPAQRRSRMPTIHEQSCGGLSRQISPSIAVSSMSDDQISDTTPHLPSRTPNLNDESPV